MIILLPVKKFLLFSNMPQNKEQNPSFCVPSQVQPGLYLYFPKHTSSLWCCYIFLNCNSSFSLSYITHQYSIILPNSTQVSPPPGHLDLSTPARIGVSSYAPIQHCAYLHYGSYEKVLNWWLNCLSLSKQTAISRCKGLAPWKVPNTILPKYLT